MAMNNSLAEVHPELVSEWSEKNLPLKPDEVNAKSRENVWWKCRHDHSWSMKINERTILKKGCRICEQEYLSLFPALAVSYYSNKKGLKAELGRMATESGFVRYTFEKVIRLKEIFAAKGNALITRAAARDLYDWCNMLSEGLFEEQRDLFRKCR